MPDGFAWDDTPETSQFLVEAVKVWPDTAARDQMIANLMASVQLGDAAGKQAMFEAVVADGAALAGLTLCGSDIHRSFWLYVNHPTLFDPRLRLQLLGAPRAADPAIRSGPEAPAEVRTDSAWLRCAAIGLLQSANCNAAMAAWPCLVEHPAPACSCCPSTSGTWPLRLEFEGSTLKRRVGNPNIHMVLEYAKSTGVVRTLVRGGAKYQQMLVGPSPSMCWSVKANAHRISRPPGSVDAAHRLRRAGGVRGRFLDELQLKALALSPDAALKIECTAMHSPASNARCMSC